MCVAGQTILITGGGGGIGSALARQLAARGDNVIVFGRREEPLAAVVREVGPELTELTLTHEHLPSTAYRDAVNGGWTGLLPHLEALLAEGPAAQGR